MRCNNCGMDYIADNAANCPRCGASLGAPGYQQAPDQQYQQQPQQPPQQFGGQYQQPQGAYPPQQGGYYQQPPMPPKRVATVRKLDLTEILMLVSGMFLFAAALWNLSELKGGFDAFPFILGILALLGALIALANVIMPALLKQLDGEVMNIMMLVFAAIFILWGLVVTFTWDFGSLGEFVCVGGIGLLMAGLLRMGILK